MILATATEILLMIEYSIMRVNDKKRLISSWTLCLRHTIMLTYVNRDITWYFSAVVPVKTGRLYRSIAASFTLSDVNIETPSALHSI